eukprot:TRINITY_DN2377_c0_g2_i2.p1 TRINITY_DN2377_c0_g2~~TRINITY_DN2377_c0_g2_i2.p1  ORF type:complete len:249 (-),score=32.60 TRINITY_DN2377_c0_g2_i2:20-742(-)
MRSRALPLLMILMISSMHGRLIDEQPSSSSTLLSASLSTHVVVESLTARVRLGYIDVPFSILNGLNSILNLVVDAVDSILLLDSSKNTWPDLQQNARWKDKIVSAVIDASFRGPLDFILGNFNDEVNITFVVDNRLDNLCMAFINVTTKRWQCADRGLVWLSNNTVKGSTNHFTSYAILVDPDNSNNNNNGDGGMSPETRLAIIIGSVGGFVVVAIIVAVVLVVLRRRQPKESKLGKFLH